MSVALSLLTLAQLATSQVLITELQPNSIGPEPDGEWMELHNTSSSAVSLEDWTLSDYTGAGAGAESMTLWTFPAGAVLQPRQVITIAVQSAAFALNYSMPSDYELASGDDDPMTPNLVAAGGTDSINLVNSAAGDALILRDAMGAVVDEMEWGNVDRPIVGSPASGTAGQGSSWIRVNNTGSSFADFIVTMMPTPGEGYSMPEGPILANTAIRPAHIDFGQPLTIVTTATDSDGVDEVNVYIGIATSSTGNAQMSYVQEALTSTVPGLYSFTGMPGNLDPVVMFSDPATFHDRYLRFFIDAIDSQGNESRDPADADTPATNEIYIQKNVMPSAPSPIRDTRVQETDGRLRWVGHSAKIRGVVTGQQGVFASARIDFSVVDDSDTGIRIFSFDEPPAFPIRVGDIVEATGELVQFSGIAELAGDNLSFEIVGEGGAVETTTVTIQELLTRGEELESRVVHIADVEFAEPSTNWPGPDRDGNIRITDPSGGQLVVRIVTSNDLSGMSAPQYGFHITGIVGQFPAMGEFLGGYQIYPRGINDITAKPMPPMPDGGIRDSGGNNNNPDGGPNNGPDAGGGGGGGGEPEEDGCNCNTSTNAPLSGANGLALFALLAGGLVLARRRR
jgi:MYXO-CTERM domain-containing protein